jgi:hypothetical protein
MTRDPRSAVAFDWDEANEAKLQARGIRPDEVERLFENRPDFSRGKRHGTARWMMEGRDPVSGKWLRIGIVWKDSRAGILRAMHGLELRR